MFNEYDNDGDGDTYCLDEDCFSPACEEVCGDVYDNDGMDNDGDGYIDCPDDIFFNYGDNPAPSPAPICEQFTIKCQQVVGSLCRTGLPTGCVSTFDDHDNDAPSCKLSDDDECKTP